MIRRFNYTNRIRIKRQDISIKLINQDDEYYFEVDISKINNYELPPESLVFLEAYRLSYYQRFGFGTFENPAPAELLKLERIDTYEGILFRLKITEFGSTHKILAEADAIPIIVPNQKSGEGEPLLPVKPTKELENEIYRIDFSGEQPILLINSNAGNYRDIGRSPAFLSLVIPSILREILTRIIIDDMEEIEDNDDWHARWIKFIKQFPGLGEIPTKDDGDYERLEWIQNAVTVFAKKQQTLNTFKKFWRDEE